MSLETSPEKPASLHSINSKIAEWIQRLGEVWVEGVTQINARTGAAGRPTSGYETWKECVSSGGHTIGNHRGP